MYFVDVMMIPFELVMWASSEFFFFKPKTAYKMRISDWSSDVCSSDLKARVLLLAASPLFNRNPDYAQIVDNRGVKLFSQVYDREKWHAAADAAKEIGRATCRERVCPSV